jgi:hypothetical protein
VHQSQCFADLRIGESCKPAALIGRAAALVVTGIAVLVALIDLQSLKGGRTLCANRKSNSFGRKG